MEENNLDLKKKYAIPDHYEFNKSEILQMLDLSIKNNFQPITTEKDYYRIKKYGFKNIKFLKIKLEIFEKEKFIKHILNYL